MAQNVQLAPKADPLEDLLRAAQNRTAQRAKPPRPAPRTLAELERSASLASAIPFADNPPRALTLVTTTATCECGRSYTMPNRAVLVRFDKQGLSNAVHYDRQHLPQYAHLPRERKTVHINVPFCEECF